MEEILDSLKRIVARWTATRVQITSNLVPGDLTIPISASHRFRVGDEVMIRTATQGQTPLVIGAIPSQTSVVVTTPVLFPWNTADNIVLEKTFNQMFIQGIYLGEPENIPRYPAVTINAQNRHSDWLTMRSTKEAYNVQLTVYVEDSTQEEGYRFLLRMVKAIQFGLKQNIYPLVGPYDTVALTVDAAVNDEFIKVADTSVFEQYNRIFIEDAFATEERRVVEVVDSTTLQISDPGVCQAWLVSNGTQVIRVLRHIYYSWPQDIQYGKIFKGTMLKAATIDWIAWEQELQQQPPIDTHLL